MSLSDSRIKKEFTPEEQAFNLEQERQNAFLEESGLEGADVQKLRNTMLSAEEAVCARSEQLEDARIRKSRKKDWDEYIDEKRRWGRALHHSDLLRHLRRLIPNLHVEDGVQKDRLSLYIWDRTHPFNDKIGGTVFLAWIHRGDNPEYEIDIVNDVGIAIGQKRGWRTVLLRMICRRDAKTFYPKSLFTEQQAVEEFGEPTQGNTARNYREHLYKFRNTSPERAKMEAEIQQAAQRYRYS